MASVEIYTRPRCGFCTAAKRLLDGKGLSYQEIDVAEQPARRSEMVERSGGRNTLPQIFVDGRHLGDCQGLFAAERSGQLDRVLGG